MMHFSHKGSIIDLNKQKMLTLTVKYFSISYSGCIFNLILMSNRNSNYFQKLNLKSNFNLNSKLISKPYYYFNLALTRILN